MDLMRTTMTVVFNDEQQHPEILKEMMFEAEDGDDESPSLRNRRCSSVVHLRTKQNNDNMNAKAICHLAESSPQSRGAETEASSIKVRVGNGMPNKWE
jgi:hypothetical protein